MNSQRLSALECVSRGVSNLRGNWKLVLLVFAQIIACGVVAFLGVVVLMMAGIGASLDGFSLESVEDVENLREALARSAFGWKELAIVLAVLFVFLAVLLLVYSWFQGGILATLDRGERQAPRGTGSEMTLFETFSGRNFSGWASQYVWPLFWFFNWLTLLLTVALFGLVLLAGLGVFLLAKLGQGIAIAVGCVLVLPLILLMLALQIWLVIGQTLVVNDFGVFRATNRALVYLGRRFWAAIVIAVLFLVAQIGVAVVFLPLSQGLAIALGDGGAAALAVQILLTFAQWLVGGVLSVALFGSVVALTRTEIDHERRLAS